MSGFSLLNSFARLSIRSTLQSSFRSITTYKPQLFRVTPCLCAEPLKKKKRIDPAIIKQREERRRKKMEKQIRRLEKHARQLKPIEEFEIPIAYIEEKEKHTRKPVELSESVIEYRALLEKQWTRSVTQEKIADIRNIDRIVSSQTKALESLREESEELYQEAILPDTTLIPYVGKGPVSTPPIKDYMSPDGEYIDVTRKWE